MNVQIRQFTLVCLCLLVGGVWSSGPDYGSNAKIRCDGTSFYKQTKITYPSQKNDCTYTFKAHSWFVCQLRVDFDLSLAGPTMRSGQSYYDCNDDYLEIGGRRYCGNDKQQHVYLPFNRTAGQKEVVLRVVLADRSANRGLEAAIYQIKVTQLECSLGSPLRSLPLVANVVKSVRPRTFFNDGFWIAPVGCLQYFPETEGAIESFNYNDGSGVYPGNRDYAICFRRTSSTQSLQLTVDHFQLPPNTERQFDDVCRSQILTEGSVDDYLSIPAAEVSGTGIRASLFCGTMTAGTVINSKSFGPMVLGFHSDSRHVDGMLRNGFRLRYKLLSK